MQRAELGDLTGRAAQAVLLTRADVSPVQVAAADEILAGDPLGGDDLFLQLDPTAASVAAAHWLQAAAEVAAERSGIAVTAAVQEADNIEALPHATPTAVLEATELGLSPRQAVTGLIRGAMAVAEGKVADVEELRARIDEAQELADQYAQDERTYAELTTVRLTPLDPQRPARDLLEDLLFGIRGCRLLYGEYANDVVDGMEDDDDDDDEDVNSDEGDFPDEQISTAFCHGVRIRATHDRHRLL